MESYSLYQLNEYIRRVIALNFREPIWIEAEIVQINDSRGNHYLELIEKEEGGDKIIAQAAGVIWYRNFAFIKKKHGELVYDLLQDGSEVRIKCQIDFHERYGMKLVIHDVDPNYTFGKHELKKQQIINQLEEEGLVELNKSILIPEVVQRIAVISSSGAAGYQDFVQQLQNNQFGYTYRIDLYDSAVQGKNVSQDTCAAIEEIASYGDFYHAVAIIRGGGSKIDLGGYDDYNIAKAIAVSELPFIIGIGHDIDTTVADLVACLSLKTPTAVADYLLERSAQFESKCVQLSQTIAQQATRMVGRQDLLQQSLSERLKNLSSQLGRIESNKLEQLSLQFSNLISASISHEKHRLDRLELQLLAQDPQEILAKGYAYIMRGESAVSQAKSLKPNDNISITFADGEVHAEITEK